MNKLHKFAGELGLSRHVIEFRNHADAHPPEPNAHFARIFLTLKKQALVEVVFAGVGSCTKSYMNLWSWDNNEGAPDSYGKVGRSHPVHQKLIWRTQIVFEEDKIKAISSLASAGTYLTNTERAVFVKIANKFRDYSRSNSVRFVLGL